MIVAGIASININNLSGLWVPFGLMCAAGAVGTLFYLKFMCKRLYPDYANEALMSMYGMLTGTISSGVLLLREIDGEFKTPAANNLILGTGFGIAFGAPMLILVGMASKSLTMTYIVFGLLFVYLAALVSFMLLFKGRKNRL
jgi:ESS family glutamate:Na+ symporter